MARPRGFIEDYNPYRKTRELLEQVEAVLYDYSDELPITARQLFYRLVGTVDYEKSEAAYGRLTNNLSNFRRAGLVPWDAIRDDGATVLAPLEFASPEEILERAEQLAAEGQGVRLEGQPSWPEVWCEAAGMAPQLHRVASDYGVTVYSSGGFDSVTLKYEAACRIAARDVPTVVLHVGDYDPSGETLYNAVAEDVEAFVEDLGGEVEFRRAAITPEQISRYQLPGAPAKKSSHAATWNGDLAVQAEALPPDALAAEVRQAVEAELDLDLLEDAKSGEAENRERFDEMMRKLRGDDGEAS